MKLNKNLCCLLAAAAFCTALLPVSAAAYTADDVAAKARASGWPDYLIQAGYNEWSSGAYTQEQLDEAYASVAQYDEQTGRMIANSLGIRYVESAAAAADAPADSAEPAAPDAPASDETPATEAPAAPITVVKTDGTEEERIPKSEFVSMTLEEKKDYVNSLTEESQTAFMGSLTTEERNSILKQLPAEEKAALIQTYVDAASGMGMNVSVDNIEGSDISMTIRDDGGTVVGKTAIGTIIDETGIDHTPQLALAFLAALAAVLGFAGIYRKMC